MYSQMIRLDVFILQLSVLYLRTLWKWSYIVFSHIIAFKIHLPVVTLISQQYNIVNNPQNNLWLLLETGVDSSFFFSLIYSTTNIHLHVPGTYVQE